jgi:hypothetical protein
MTLSLIDNDECQRRVYGGNHLLRDVYVTGRVKRDEPYLSLSEY